MHELVLTIGRNKLLIHSLSDAAREWGKYRDGANPTGFMLGASESPRVFVYQAGKKIARVSYNGRIWDMKGRELNPNALGA